MRIPSLERIVSETLSAIEKSKIQIYDIAENARSECDRIKKELQEIQFQVMGTIEKVDSLERLEKAARLRLMEVSQNILKHTEDEIRQAYEKASELQMELGSLREREHQLKLRRNELERSLRKLLTTVDNAEGLVTQVGVVLDYLGGNLKWINNELEVVQQKRQLAPRIIQAQEEERKRVAREIHDGPAQAMANVVMRTEVCEKLLDIDMEAARKELKITREMIKNSLHDVRRIIFDLRPMTLDDLGLIPAINRYAESLKERFNTPIEINCTGQRQRVNSLIEVALFRVVQEAIQNTIKHANATHILVSLELNYEHITILVKDNGTGFDADAYLKEPRPDRYGLLGMRERLEILGGQLNVRSNPGEGTEILAILPLD
jgi:two-component system sensor histidine kinase DegS